MDRKSVLILVGIVGIIEIGLVIFFPALGVGLLIPFILIIGFVNAFLPFFGLLALAGLLFYFSRDFFSTQHTTSRTLDPRLVNRGTQEKEIEDWSINVAKSKKKDDQDYRYERYQKL